jgi:hypothetical protein
VVPDFAPTSTVVKQKRRQTAQKISREKDVMMSMYQELGVTGRDSNRTELLL